MKQVQNFIYLLLLHENGLPLHSSSPLLAKRCLAVRGLEQGTAGPVQKRCREIWDKDLFEKQI